MNEEKYRMICTLIEEEERPRIYGFHGETEEQAVKLAAAFAHAVQAEKPAIQITFSLEVLIWKAVSISTELEALLTEG